jgi:hypothetical protein
MMRSPVIGANAIFLRASRERPRTAMPCVCESDDKELREATAPSRSAVPRLSNTLQGRPNRREAKTNGADGDLGQTDRV